MAVEQTGSLLFLAVSGQNPAGQSITVPADAQLCVFFFHYHNAAGSGGGLSSLTLNGVAFTEAVEVEINGDAATVGCYYLVNPATGSQTLDWAWVLNPEVGPGVWVAFYKGVDTGAPVRDADVLSWSGGATDSVTIDSDTTDMVVGVVHSYAPFDGPDGAPGGSGQTILDTDTFNDYESDFIQEDSPGASSTTVSGYGSYGGVIALSIREGDTAVTSDGALALQEHAVAAAGSEQIPGAAALALQEHAIAAAGSEQIPGAAALALQEHAIAAAGMIVNPVSSSGALALQEHVIVAAGTAGTVITAAGASAIRSFSAAAFVTIVNLLRVTTPRARGGGETRIRMRTGSRRIMQRTKSRT